MSGKYSKKKKSINKSANPASRKHSRQKNTRRGLWVAIIIALAALCLLIGLMLSLNQGNASDIPKQTTAPTETVAETDTQSDVQPSAPAKIEEVGEASISLGYGMEITDIGSYTGVYMEDGSDEIVSGVLMIVVTNTGDEDIQFSTISLTAGVQTATFSLSTLPAGKSVVLLEQNRMTYSDDVAYTSAIAENVTLFNEPISLYEGQLEIQILDGAINVSNISGEDISNDIFIYYKNSAADMYYGGITYRVRIEGGLKADELKQIMATHFSASGSAIIFVSFGA